MSFFLFLGRKIVFKSGQSAGCRWQLAAILNPEQFIHFLAGQMRFETTKCFHLSATLKRDIAECTYFLCGTGAFTRLLSYISWSYCHRNLSWSKHCDELCAKANRVLGILRRNLLSCSPSTKERACTSLVCPLVNYGQQPGLHPLRVM